MRKASILFLLVLILGLAIFTTTSPDQWSREMVGVMLISMLIGMGLFSDI